MPDPTQLERTSMNSRRQEMRRERGSFFRKNDIATYEVLGRTLTTSVSRGMTEERAFIRAVEEGGGRVFRKFYQEFGKFEIAAIVFRDSALVKNDPDFIAQQDFSAFGKDSERIKLMAVEKARMSEGGIHFFIDGSGIPVLVNKKGKLTFLSLDEMKAGCGRKIKAEGVTTPFDPQTTKEFKEVSDALRDGDNAMLERLRKAGGAHSESRKESIEPLSTYTILDAVTGEEIGAAAANAKLGKNIVVVSDRLFVPEIMLISQFSASSQQAPADACAHKPAWEWIFLLSGNAREKEDLLPSVYTVCDFGRQAADGADRVSGAASPAQATGTASEAVRTFDTPAGSAMETSQRSAPAPVSNQISQIAPAEAAKALRPIPPRAALFDGFAPDVIAGRASPAPKPNLMRQFRVPVMDERIQTLPAAIPLPASQAKNRKRRYRRRTPKPAPQMPKENAGAKERKKGTMTASPAPKNKKETKEKGKRRIATYPVRISGNGRNRKERKRPYGSDNPGPRPMAARIRRARRCREEKHGARIRPGSPAAQRTRKEKAGQRPAVQKRERTRNESRERKKEAPSVRRTKDSASGTSMIAKQKEARIEMTGPKQSNQRAAKKRAPPPVLPIFTSRKARARNSSGRRAA